MQYELGPELIDSGSSPVSLPSNSSQIVSTLEALILVRVAESP